MIAPKINVAAARRLLVLEILKANRGIDLAIAFEDLWKTLHNLGHPVSAHDLREYLSYLAGRGFVKLTRREDLAGFRLAKLPSGDMHPDDILFVKLTPAGLDEVE